MNYKVTNYKAFDVYITRKGEFYIDTNNNSSDYNKKTYLGHDLTNIENYIDNLLKTKLKVGDLVYCLINHSTRAIGEELIVQFIGIEYINVKTKNSIVFPIDISYINYLVKVADISHSDLQLFVEQQCVCFNARQSYYEASDLLDEANSDFDTLFKKTLKKINNENN